MDSVNVLIVSGVLERVALRFREDGTAVCTGSLRCEDVGSTGTVFKTFVPFEAYGKLADTVGERQAGDVVLLQGKVFWRKYRDKGRGGKERPGAAGEQVQPVGPCPGGAHSGRCLWPLRHPY